MATDRAPNRLIALLLGVLAVAALVGILWIPSASAASGDVTLVSSNPADGDQLPQSPTEIELVFSQTVSEETTVTVACNGTAAPVGPARLGEDSLTVTVPVVGAIGKAKCNVAWNVPMADGTNTTGLFTFDVTDDAPAATEAPEATDSGGSNDDGATDGSGESSTSSASPDEPARVGGALGIVRLVAYISLAALFGGIVLIAVAWPEGVEYAVTVRYLRTVWIAGFIATVLQVALTTAQLGEHSVMGSFSPTAWSDLFDTTSGKALLIRMLLVAACGWVALQPERVLDPTSRTLSLALPGLVMATYGFSRTGGDLALIGVAAGALHGLAVAVWFGGLMMLSRVVLLGPGDEDLVHAVRGYTRYSTSALVITVVTGAIQTYRLDGGALFGSTHGRLLLLKVIGVAAMAYLATAAKPMIERRLGHADHLDARTASTLRRTMSAEMLIGVFVLAVTSWMLSTIPENIADANAVRYEYDSGRSGGDFDVRVQLTSTEVGRSGVRVEVYSPLEGLANMRVVFRPPADEPTAPGMRLEIPLTGAGAAQLDADQGIPFTVPGDWTIDIRADGPDGRLPSVTDTVTITGDPVEVTEPPADSTPTGDSTPSTAG